MMIPEKKGHKLTDFEDGQIASRHPAILPEDLLEVTAGDVLSESTDDDDLEANARTVRPEG